MFGHNKKEEIRSEGNYVTIEVVLNLSYSPNIMEVNKQDIIKWAGYVAHKRRVRRRNL